MIQNLETSNISATVDKKIADEKLWLEAQGIKISAVITFGSAQWGSNKPYGSDMDVFFLFENDTKPQSSELIIVDDDDDSGPGYRFVVDNKFDANFPLTHLEASVTHRQGPSRY